MNGESTHGCFEVILGEFKLSMDLAVKPGTVLVLFGPSGSGKTTVLRTIAGLIAPSEGVICIGGVEVFNKINGVNVPSYKRKVALISVSTNSRPSFEKIRGISKMINVPFSIVKNKNELNELIKKKYEDFDTILIDTEGCSQRNESKLKEIKNFFDEREHIHNSLVLSATSKDSDMNEVTRKFGCMPIDSIIFTKLDESATYGSLFNHTIRFKKPLSYLTLGQKIPEDLEIASRERLVDLLLNISGS